MGGHASGRTPHPRMDDHDEIYGQRKSGRTERAPGATETADRSVFVLAPRDDRRELLAEAVHATGGAGWQVYGSASAAEAREYADGCRRTWAELHERSGWSTWTEPEAERQARIDEAGEAGKGWRTGCRIALIDTLGDSGGQRWEAAELKDLIAGTRMLSGATCVVVIDERRPRFDEARPTAAGGTGADLTIDGRSLLDPALWRKGSDERSRNTKRPFYWPYLDEMTARRWRQAAALCDAQQHGLEQALGLTHEAAEAVTRRARQALGISGTLLGASAKDAFSGIGSPLGDGMHLHAWAKGMGRRRLQTRRLGNRGWTMVTAAAARIEGWADEQLSARADALMPLHELLERRPEAAGCQGKRNATELAAAAARAWNARSLDELAETDRKGLGDAWMDAEPWFREPMLCRAAVERNGLLETTEGAGRIVFLHDTSEFVPAETPHRMRLPLGSAAAVRSRRG